MALFPSRRHQQARVALPWLVIALLALSSCDAGTPRSPAREPTSGWVEAGAAHGEPSDLETETNREHADETDEIFRGGRMRH